MRRTRRQARDPQFVAERCAMPLGYGRGHLEWHAGTVCGLDVAGALVAVEGADKKLDWTRPAEQEEPVTSARDVHGRQGGDDRDDRLRPCNLGLQPIDRFDRQPAATDVRRNLDHPDVGGVGERGTE